MSSCIEVSVGLEPSVGCSSISGNRLRSTCVRLLSCYPLRLLQQEHWAPFLSIVMLGFGGGFVEGDESSLHVKLHSRSTLCLRTQGSTKIYKSIDGRVSKQHIKAAVAEKAFLVQIPDPTTCFPNSKYEQRIDIDVEREGSLVLVDWYTAGRTNRGEHWDMQFSSNNITIRYDGIIQLYENQVLQSSASGSIAEKVGNAAAFGCIVFLGPATTDMRARLQCLKQRQAFRRVRESAAATGAAAARVNVASPLVSVADISHICSIVRFSASSTEEAYQLLAFMLRPVCKSLPGLRPYEDRLHGNAPSHFQYPHPIYEMQQFDAAQETS